ncbi:MAG: hypothetical protein KatS3mg082_3128 [Nitrospiraceae bacterium]|nr:MAG: hypothetical protein KatS3mg082_3128 [Nitrospiraceae bacterium]
MVVARQTDEWLSGLDREVLRGRGWRLRVVDLRRRGPNWALWLREGLRSKMSRALFDCGLRTASLAVRSYVRGADELVALALEEGGDCFIAHTQAALPVAAAAAERRGVSMGCDYEDLLPRMAGEPSRVVELLEARYLEACAYISVPSEEIARHLTARYSVRPPVVLYNVFPVRLADGVRPPASRPSRRVLRLHWFGQTIGPGRGLEDAVQAVGMLGDAVELHLRGRVSRRYWNQLAALGQRWNALGRILVHSPVEHDQLIRAVCEYDVGLALERPEHEAYARTVTNKLFGYLLAGLGIAATDTPGHREVLQQIPEAGFLYRAGDAEALAAGLVRWVEDPRALRRAQEASWDAARSRFCWDREKEKFLAVIRQLLC